MVGRPATAEATARVSRTVSYVRLLSSVPVTQPVDWASHCVSVQYVARDPVMLSWVCVGFGAVRCWSTVVSCSTAACVSQGGHGLLGG